MTDAPLHSQVPPPMQARADEMTLPIVVYALLLGGFLTGGLSALVGLVAAYVLKGDAGPRAASHYVFEINTFWLATLAYVVVGVLSIMGLPLLFLHGAGIVFFVLAGLLGVAASIWFAARCVIGLVRAAQGEAYPDPRTWLAERRAGGVSGGPAA